MQTCYTNYENSNPRNFEVEGMSLHLSAEKWVRNWHGAIWRLEHCYDQSVFWNYFSTQVNSFYRVWYVNKIWNLFTEIDVLLEIAHHTSMIIIILSRWFTIIKKYKRLLYQWLEPSVDSSYSCCFSHVPAKRFLKHSESLQISQNSKYF